MGLRLYDEEHTEELSDEIMEDFLIDPTELDRAEDAEHSHFAPCTVPMTSEARAQYGLTLLQLVSDGRDKTTATKAIKSLVALPVSVEFCCRACRAVLRTAPAAPIDRGHELTYS